MNKNYNYRTMRKQLTLFIFTILLFHHTGSAQGLAGKISDTQGHVIPYATIFVKELSLGTTSNSEGLYELKIPSGQYTIQFRSMGYNPENLSIQVSGNQTITKNIVLSEQLFQLQQINVYASRENPAYPIMRRAISMAPYYLNQVKSYQANVYLKGTARLEKVPRMLRNKLNLEINGTQLKEGDLFVGENISEISFTAPDKYKQKIISSNISMMDNQSQAFDMGLITSSPYQSQIDYLITPLSPQAFSHYKFSLEGTFNDGGYLINKIKVTPKRESKQTVRGYIFIVDGLWSIHSLEFSSKQLFGTITTKMLFNEIIDNVWLPMSHTISVDGKMMGVAGKAHYTSSVKYKNVIENKQLVKPKLLTEFLEDQEFESEIQAQERTKRQKRMDELMKKEKLSNREAMKLASLMEKEIEASKPKEETKNLEIKDNYEIEKADSFSIRTVDYWDEFRPNPLTQEEAVQLAKADSMRLETTAKKENAPKKSGTKAFIAKSMFGTSWRSKDSTLQVNYKGLLNLGTLGFNAVEGFHYGQQAQWILRPENTGTITGNLDLNYAFGINSLQWEHRLLWHYNPLYMGNFELNAGNQIVDFNGDKGTSPFVNSLSSLLLKVNYPKYIRNQYVELAHEIEVLNGLEIRAELLYSERNTLENSTNFSFFRTDKTYSSNAVEHYRNTTIQPQSSKASISTISIEYTPFRPYVIRKGEKQARWAKWPTLTASWKHAESGILGSDALWDYIEGRIDQRIKTGAYSRLNYQFKGGAFLNSKHLTFADFARIETSQSPVQMRDLINSFRLLPDYTYNADQWHAEAHITYLTPYLLIKYLPILSETMIREQVHLNYLTLPGFRNYTEIGYSLGDIGFVGEVGIFASFENGKYKRLGISSTFRF